MSDLIVVGFSNKYEAEEALLTLRKMEKEHLIDLEDAAIVVKNEKGKYRDKKARLKVLSTLQLIDRPEIFVGGDCAVNWDKSIPATAQAAYQQGSAIANNLQALATNKTPDMANIRMRGTMLKLGLNDAAADSTAC